MGQLSLTEEDAEVVLNALLCYRAEKTIELEDGKFSHLPQILQKVKGDMVRAERLCKLLEDYHVRSV